MARHRSRIAWLENGDANTTYFHLHAAHRRIAKLHNERKIIVDQASLEAFTDHFAQLFSVLGDRPRTINFGELGVVR